MGESFPKELLLRFLHATPEEVDYIKGYFARRPLPGAAQRSAGGSSGRSPAEARGAPDSPTSPAYVFQWTGRDWKVVCGGGKPFYLENMLAARCSNYLLHHPNELIACFDLEVEVQPEKGAARARNSIQADSDAQALREYQPELRRLQAEKERAQAAGKQEEVARLEVDIQAYESALRGGGPSDTGQRAYDNVRKAFRVLMEHLRQGGPEEGAFAEHLHDNLRIGLECLYSQAEGRIWG